MERLILYCLIFAMLFSVCGCALQKPVQTTPVVTTEPQPAGPMDLSGKYPLDEIRNEAVINLASPGNGDVGNARVFYHIFVGSFSDSNGDGLGDLRGIINRFDYLNDGNPESGLSLGVEGIWLSPIFTSPSYHKYDVADYYQIDPKFGTMEDLQEMIQLCHEREVKLILDLVINHTASNHPWFREFTAAHVAGDTENEYYDYYTWSTEGLPGKAMYNITTSGHLYEGNFSGSMPELNYDNEVVRQKMVEVAKYYLDMGIDGFRFDAAKYVYYGEESRNVEFWDWYMAQLRAIKPDLYSVAEVWDGDGVVIPYFSSTNCFNFTMAQTNGQIALAAKAGDVNAYVSYVDRYIDSIKAENPDAFPVTFIANHDTDRAAGFLPVSYGQAQVAANLSILMPGSSFVYYGEEIGMKGSRGGANTDANRRLAMLWGDGDTVRDPQGADYSSEQTNGTVADQLPNGDSLYNHYKKLIQVRKACPEIALGDFTPLVIADSYVGGFLSTYESSSVAVFHNTSTETVQIDLSQFPELSAMNLFAAVGIHGASLDGTVLTIEGQTSVVLK